MAEWVKFENGFITNGPIVSDDQPEGYVEFVQIVNMPPNSGIPVVTMELVDGKCVRTVTATVDYRAQRASEYPSVADQMDMMWHAMNDGQISKVEPFYSEILAVKVRYPKP